MQRHLIYIVGGAVLVAIALFVMANGYLRNNKSVIAETTAEMPPYSALKFVDLYIDHPHFPAVMYLNAAGVMTGYPGTQEIRPDQGISRAELLKVAYQAVGIMPDSLAPLPGFADDEINHWSQVYINDAYARGVVSGYPVTPPTFQRDNIVSRVETLKILFNLAKFHVPIEASPQIKPAEDVPIVSWYLPYVERVLALRLMELAEPDNNRFLPDQPMTRGTVADLIYRLNAIVATGSLFYAGQNPNNLQTALAVLPFPSLVPEELASRGNQYGSGIAFGGPSTLPPLPLQTAVEKKLVMELVSNTIREAPYQLANLGGTFVFACLSPDDKAAPAPPVHPDSVYVQFYVSPPVGNLFYSHPDGRSGLFYPIQAIWASSEVTDTGQVKFWCDLVDTAAGARLNSHHQSFTLDIIPNQTDVATRVKASQYVVYPGTPNDVVDFTCELSGAGSRFQDAEYIWKITSEGLPAGEFIEVPGFAANQTRWRVPSINRTDVNSTKQLVYYSVTCELTTPEITVGRYIEERYFTRQGEVITAVIPPTSAP